MEDGPALKEVNSPEVLEDRNGHNAEEQILRNFDGG